MGKSGMPYACWVEVLMNVNFDKTVVVRQLRQKIRKITGLSYPSVTKSIKFLLEKKLIKEEVESYRRQHDVFLVLTEEGKSVQELLLKLSPMLQ